MERKPITIATILVLLGLGGVGYATRDKWGDPVKVADVPQATTAETPKVAEAPKAAEEPKAVEAPKVAEAPKAVEEPKAAEPPKAIEAPAEQKVATAEPPKAVEAPATQPAAEPAKPAEPATNSDNLPLPSIGTVRIEKDGSAIIAGRAEPGSTVNILLNGAVVASGKANDAGDFAIIPEKPLPAEAGVLTVEMTGKDGKPVTSQQTVAMIGRSATEAPSVAVLTPGEPTKVVQSGGEEAKKLPPMETVMIDTVDYDDKGNMVFSGRGPAGSKVQLYADNNPLAEGMIGADGTWSIVAPNSVAVGPHELRADEIAADGTVKSRVGMPFYREDPAKVLASRTPAPAPETVTINQQVTVTTADKKTVVTATGPVTVEVTQTEPVVAAAEPPAAKPAEPDKTIAAVEPPAQPVVEVPAVEVPKAEEPAVEVPKAEVPAAEQSAAEPPAQPAAEAPATAEAPAQPAPAAPAEPEKPAVTAEPAPAVVEPPAAPVEAPKVAAVTPEVDPNAMEKSVSKVIIQPGNNLWKLSRRIYGKGTMYTVIYEANREFIKNPNLIYPGQIFTAPKTASGQ